MPWVVPFIIPIITGIVVSVAVGFIMRALTPKPSDSKQKPEAQSRLETVRSAVAPHRIVYGARQRVGGVLIYAQVNGGSQEYWSQVVAVAGHQLNTPIAWYFDDVMIPPTQISAGLVIEGIFNQDAKLAWHDGGQSQTADALLVSTSGGKWTSDHRLRGIAYYRAELLRDETAYPTGVPNITVLVPGKLCQDARDDAVKITENPAVILWDYLLSIGWDVTDLDETSFNASANDCDQRIAVSSYTLAIQDVIPTHNLLRPVGIDTRITTGDRIRLASTGTVPGGLTAGVDYYAMRVGNYITFATSYQGALDGTVIDITSAGSGNITVTHHDQARYTCNGVWNVDQEPSQVVNDILLSCAGTVVMSSGTLRMYVGGWTASSVTIDASYLRGPISTVVAASYKELYNTMRGVYTSEIEFQPVDYPPVTNAAYVVADDNETLEQQADLPTTNSMLTAQRLAKIKLEQGRRGGAMTLRCNLKAFAIMPWDVVSISFTPLPDWNNKTWRVMSWAIVADEENGSPGIDLELKEDDSAVWGWTATDATTMNPAPVVVVPDIRVVVAPTGLTAASGNAQLLKGTDGSITSRIQVTWADGTDPNIRYTEVQWKQTTETKYNAVLTPAGSESYWLAPVQDGLQYNLQVRTVTTLGSFSPWVTLVHTVVGKTEPPNAPTGLGVTAAPGGFDLAWGDSPDADYYATEVHESNVNDRSSATLIATVSSSRMARTGLVGNAQRYYWVRNVDTSGNVSTFYPVSSTGGVSGVALGVGDPFHITHDFTSYLAGGATNFMNGAGYWMGAHSGQYKMHLGDPGGNYMSWDGSQLLIRGDLGIVGGANQIYNADGALGFDGVFTSAANSPPGGTADVTFYMEEPGGSWTLPNVRSWAAGQLDADINTYSVIVFLRAQGLPATLDINHMFPVEPDRWYEFSAHTGAHRATISVVIGWWTAAGVYISETTGEINDEEKFGGTTLDTFERLFVKGKAPANAAFAAGWVRKNPTKNGYTDSYMFVTRPLFAECSAYRLVPSPWVSGINSGPTGTYRGSITPQLPNPGTFSAGLYLTSDYMGYTSGSNVWPVVIRNNGSFYFGNAGGTQYVQWNGATLEVRGIINIVGAGGNVAAGADNTLARAQAGDVQYGYVSGTKPPADADNTLARAVAGDVQYGYISGTKPPTNADNTQAAVQVGTTITGGGITLSGGGNIKGGQSDYNTGVGWFLGYSGGGYKFSIGNPSAHRMTWDGTTLGVFGSVTDLRPWSASTTYIIYADPTLSAGGNTANYQEVKSVQTFRSGTLHVIFTMQSGGSGGTQFGRVYVNGVAAGTERSVSGGATQVFGEVIPISSGDLIQIYSKFSGLIGGYIYDFKLGNGFSLDQAFVRLKS